MVVVSMIYISLSLLHLVEALTFFFILLTSLGDQWKYTENWLEETIER